VSVLSGVQRAGLSAVLVFCVPSAGTEAR